MLYLGISHLSTLVAIADTGNLTRSAQLLGLTQSALSQRLQEAERRIGGTLFIRDQRGLRATAAGERLVRSARLILDELTCAEREAGVIVDGLPSTIRVGSRAYTFHHWTTLFLKGARDELPGLQLELVPRVSADPVHGLIEGKVDVAITAGSVVRRGVETIPLFEDEIVAIAPLNHPWAAKDRVHVADFTSEIFIGYSENQEEESEYDRVLKSQDIMPHEFLRVGLVESVVEYVAAGYGVSLLSNWSTVGAATGRVVRRRLSGDPVNLRWSAKIRSSEEALSPVRRFCDLLAQWATKRIETVGAQTISAAEGSAINASYGPHKHSDLTR